MIDMTNPNTRSDLANECPTSEGQSDQISYIFNLWRALQMTYYTPDELAMLDPNQVAWVCSATCLSNLWRMSCKMQQELRGKTPQFIASWISTEEFNCRAEFEMGSGELGVWCHSPRDAALSMIILRSISPTCESGAEPPSYALYSPTSEEGPWDVERLIDQAPVDGPWDMETLINHMNACLELRIMPPDQPHTFRWSLPNNEGGYVSQMKTLPPRQIKQLLTFEDIHEMLYDTLLMERVRLTS